MRKPYFVIETRKIDELFASMKKQNIHIAIVLDEYGGTEGLVTIEDIIEEIVGEISSEDILFHTQLGANEEFQEIGTNEYVVKGTIGLYQLDEMLAIGLPIHEFDTLNGFLIHELGHIPSSDEEVVIPYNKAEFKATKIGENRIEEVFITMQTTTRKS